MSLLTMTTNIIHSVRFMALFLPEKCKYIPEVVKYVGQIKIK